MAVLKKCLAVFLCMAILCTSVRFSTGKGLFVQEAEASPLVAAVAGVSGAITGGSISLAPALVPLATLFAGSGIFVDNTKQLVSDLTTIFNGFTDTVKDELTTVGNAALDSASSGEWTPSELLLNEFEALVKRHLFNEDGSLIAGGYSLLNSLPAYSSINLYTDYLPDCFNTRLSTVPAYIPDTNLTVQLVDSPFSTIYDYPALRIENTASGRSILVDPDVLTPWDFWNNSCGATYYISSPFVRGDTSDYHGVGFYVSVHCPLVEAGEQCSCHYSAYTSTSWDEGHSEGDYGSFVLDGFGTWYDDCLFSFQMRTSDGVWHWLTETASGDEIVETGSTALTAVLSSQSWVRQLIDEVLDIPSVGTTMYVPALNDLVLQLDKLTKAAVLENDWSKTIADYLAGVNANTAETNSWLEKIYNAITNSVSVALPVPVGNVLTGVWSTVTDVVGGVWDIIPTGFFTDNIPNFFDAINGPDIYEFWRQEDDINAIFG